MTKVLFFKLTVCVAVAGMASAVEMGLAQEKKGTAPITSGANGTQQGAIAGEKSPGKTNADYSAEPLVIDRLDTVYSFNADGTGWKQTTMAARVQSDAAVRQFGVLSFPFASATSRIEIGYVGVRRPDGSVTQTPVENAVEMPAQVTQQAPFYSDLKGMQIPVRNLHAGDELEWQVKVVLFKPEAEGQFWGSEGLIAEGIALEQSMELRVPKDKYVKVWSPKHPPQESVEGQERVYRWSAAHLEPTVGPEAEAEKEKKKKHVLSSEEQIEEEQGKFPDIAWSSFQSWAEVGEWYRKLESERVAPDAKVKAKVAEITAGKTGEEEKVKAVYSYVSTQFRYIGVAFGIGRFQPHFAAEVLENQYGDCKDKHTLLAAMLMDLGLHPAAVLVGAGIRFEDELPSPQSFNHLITQVAINGQPVWLDATAEVAPYRMLNAVIRDKEVLAIPETGAPQVERTPKDLPFPSLEKLVADGALDASGTATMRMDWTMRGDSELVFREVFHETQANQTNEVVQRISQNMGYGGTTSHVEISNAGDTADAFKFSYDYKRDKPGNDWDNLRIVAMLAPVGLPVIQDSDQPPVAAIELGTPRVMESKSTMRLPTGWSAELPEAIHAKSEYATLDETYHLDHGVLVAERRVEILKKQVPAANWTMYRKWSKDAGIPGELYIQLTRAKADQAKLSIKGSKGQLPDVAEKVEAAEFDPTAHGESASELIAEAQTDLRQHDLDGAQTKLDRAKTLDAEKEGLWTGYGYLAFFKGNLPETIADYKKEVSLHPSSYGTYSSLASVQDVFHQHAEAKETLREWMSVQPENAEPALRLGHMLIEDLQAGEAVRVAKTALEHANAEAKNEGLKLLLGKAEVKEGSAASKVEGVETLHKLMASTEDAGMLNDSAYGLAESGEAGSKYLPEAESAARKALGKLETESRTWTLDEDIKLLRGKTVLIAASWDTLGWILYREGKTNEAEKYVEAAWLTHSTLEVGDHRGEIAETEGHKSQALTAYEDALASAPGYDAMGVRKAPGPRQLEIAAKADRLRAPGKKTDANGTTEAAKQRMQKERTFALGAAGGLSGTAEYRLLLRSGGIEKMEATGSREIAGASELAAKARLSIFWPAGSEAALVRVGMVSCHGGVCELVLEP